jgi:hypothetical protein
MKIASFKTIYIALGVISILVATLTEVVFVPQALCVRWCSVNMDGMIKYVFMMWVAGAFILVAMIHLITKIIARLRK